MQQPHTATPAERLCQLTLLATAAWAVTYARFSLGPLQEMMRLDLALSDNQIAWLQGPAVAVPMALGAIPVGLLVDRYARARLFPIFVALALGSAALSAFAANLTLLMISRCLAGLALTGVVVAAYSAVADLYPPKNRGRATMVVAIGEVGGAPSAFALGGVLLGLAVPGAESWRWALLWMCVPLLPIAFLTLTLREPPRAGVLLKSSPLRAVGMELWKYRGVVVPLLLARIMVWIADGAVLVWAAPTFARKFALPSATIGMIMATALLVSGLLGPILGGPLADVCQRTGGPRRTVTALCFLALLSIPAALFALMPNAILASIGLTVFLTLSFTILPAGLTVATIVIPGELHGLFVAVCITAGAVFCIGLAPLAVSGLSALLGGPTMIGQSLTIVCCVSSILGAVVFGLAMRSFPRGGAVSR